MGPLTDQTCPRPQRPYGANPAPVASNQRMMRPEPGDKLDLIYPNTTLIDARPMYRLRQLLVHRVRDLVSQPLTPDEFLLRPMILRSRLLLSGIDDATGRWRQLYLGSSARYRAAGQLRLALFEPDADSPWRIVSGGFAETVDDRRKLTTALRRYRDRPADGLQLRVIADDLRVAG